MTNLEVLPVRTAGAAENMAVDFLLLQRYPRPDAIRFRHYEWRGPAFTFGYSQKIAFVRTQLPGGGGLDISRRATGGGVVDHRDDWTYALVIPRGHELEDMRASQSYRIVHECLAGALRAQGVAAVVNVGSPVEDSVGVCFKRAELYDVVHEATGEKIAGAAQKRNKHGMLFQGSIWRPAASTGPGGIAVDWDRFHGDFTAQLAAAMGAEVQPTPWPEMDEDETSGLVERYASQEWIEAR